MHSLDFDDVNGSKVYDLHYAPVSLAANGPHMHVANSKELESFASDYFVIVLRLDPTSDKQLWTVVCRSWRVRNAEGMLALLRPGVQNYTWPH